MLLKNLVNHCTFCVCRFKTLKNSVRSSFRAIRLYSSEEKELIKDYPTPVDNIRNFSIIAHVDHGKSTLADRILELTGAIKKHSGAQVLDKLQVEKERGITVKAQTVSLKYLHQGKEYLLNLLDTPGHVDFSAEVHRSLACCQGVILLIDANDGVQAQTVANFYLAFSSNLTIIPVINKIDLKNANPENVIKQLNALFEIKAESVLRISAKFGTGVEKLLETVVERIPSPEVIRDSPLRALVFDSYFDRYSGAIPLIYVKEGSLSVGQQIMSAHTGKCYEVKNLWFQRPDKELVKTIYAGQVGCFSCNMRSVKEATIGDTFYLKGSPVEALPGFTAAKSMVFAGIYPIDQSHYQELSRAIEKLVLNDSAVSLTNESSPALGLGWRLGFLGLLHMDVFTQRLEQEYGTCPIVTAPGVTYKAKITGAKQIAKYKGEEILFNNPADYPDANCTEAIYEPLVLGTIIAPMQYLGKIYGLCSDRRGLEKSTKPIHNDRIMMQFVLPLNEIIVDFHDTLKSITSGYASFDYEDHGFRESSIVKLQVLLNGNLVEEFSTLVHSSRATEIAKRMSAKLLEIIPRQQFLIAIQVVVGTRVLSRENIKPYRKDVTQKVKSGHDMARKSKLLRAQAEGKKKMKMIGKISLPRETFIKVLKK